MVKLQSGRTAGFFAGAVAMPLLVASFVTTAAPRQDRPTMTTEGDFRRAMKKLSTTSISTARARWPGG